MNEIIKKEAIHVIREFVKAHREYWRQNSLVDNLPNDDTSPEYINECIQLILNRYHNDAINFYDYSEATAILCCISCLVPLETLEKWELDETFFKKITDGITMAGDELGYDYRGLETIKEYARFLSDKYLIEILKRNESLDEGDFCSNFRLTIIQTLIENSSLKNKGLVKFRYFDGYLIVRIIIKRIRSFFAKQFPQYKYVTINEMNKQLKDPISTTSFLFALQYMNDFILVKLDRTSDSIFISLTKDPDPNKMNYIFDSQIKLENNNIQVLFDTKTSDHNANVNLSANSPQQINLAFDINNWDPLQFEKQENLTEILVKRLDISDEERERFDLICYIGSNLNGLPDRIVYFRDDFKVDINGNEITLMKTEDVHQMPEYFFGKSVNNICAVIGRNGSGKTSVFYSILHNSAFGFNDSAPQDSQSFLIYIVGNNYYYNISPGFSLNNKTGVELKNTQRIPSNITICYISNSFDPFSLNLTSTKLTNQKDDKSSCFSDLSTNYQIQRFKETQNRASHKSENEHDSPKIDCLISYQEQERYRISNLERFMREVISSKESYTEQFNLKEIDINKNSFPQLSSGEYARWSLFSKMLSVFYRGAETENNPLPEVPKHDNYIIMFDEAELYMHPEWQRTLINDIILFLEKININQQFFSNVTLLFSSNSPFLMSDLPAERIQLFDADDSNKKTFGQNIYTILTDRFFMPNGPTGSFANRCINKALEVTSDSPLDDKKYLAYIADIIGDKILSLHLKKKAREYCIFEEGSES